VGSVACSMASRASGAGISSGLEPIGVTGEDPNIQDDCVAKISQERLQGGLTAETSQASSLDAASGSWRSVFNQSRDAPTDVGAQKGCFGHGGLAPAGDHRKVAALFASCQRITWARAHQLAAAGRIIIHTNALEK
jgi:hypothetical protein